MDITEIITQIAPILITAGATLIAVYLTNRGNSNRLEQQLIHEHESKSTDRSLEKVEELYVLLDRYTSSLFCQWLPFMRVMQGDLTYNQALDITIDSSPEDENFYRVEMLVMIYFPELKTSYLEHKKVRDHINRIISDHKSQYKSGNLDGSKFLGPIRVAMEEFDSKTEVFKTEIKELATSIVDFK